MLDPVEFLDDLRGLGLHGFFGVPDSLLGPLIGGIQAQAAHGRLQAETTASEGAAVGLGIGRYLATGEMPVVFMQNSGLGNAVNPLVSLACDKVYAVPMLLIVGWRGEMLDGRQLKDEPQHKFQGEITLPMLDLLEVPYQVISAGMGADGARRAATRAVGDARRLSRPAALVIRGGSFAKVAAATGPTGHPDYPTREDAIAAALGALPADTPVVGTTGKISREIYELCAARDLRVPAFLSVGGMGHAGMIAAGVAAARPASKTACFDGDGAIVMHAGSLATSARVDSLIHLAFNNQVHDSVGGQSTAAPDVRLDELARVFGYTSARRVTRLVEIAPAVVAAADAGHASFVEIMVRPGARPDLGRPAATPAESKQRFMAALGVTHD